MRFAETNFATTVQTVLDAVKELDQIFSEMGLADEPWRNDEEVNRDSIRKIVKVLESVC